MRSRAKFRAHLPFFVLILVLAAYLGAKTLPEDGWSGWKEGSAQTLLTLEHWDRDGIVAHRALFLPIGASVAVKYLDDPALRQHARGIVTGYLIGKRLYYTHYPSGYLIPFYMLKKAGADERHLFRLASLAVSLAALVLMYALFNIATTPLASFLGVLYYAGSTMFLNFSDSLANQPIDDLLRFAILFLSLSAYREEGHSKGRTMAIWALYFALAASSYDSVIFVFIWLAGLDYIRWLRTKDRVGKSVPWKRWALYALAPVAAVSVQMLQNLWYLGLDDLILDIKGVFLSRVGAGAGPMRRASEIMNVIRLATGLEAWAAIPAVALVFAAFVYLRRAVFHRWTEVPLLFLALAAGLAYTAVFAKTTDLDYQGRQLAPFLGLLAGSGTALLIKGALSPMSLLNRRRLASSLLFAGLAVSAAALWAGQAWRTAGYVADWPNNATTPMAINAYRTIGTLSNKEAVVFSVNTKNAKEFPQAPPTFEYYAGRAVLSFNDPALLVRDLRRLKELSAEPFDAIIYSPQFEVIEQFLPYSANRDIRVFDGGFALLIEHGSPLP